MARTQKAIRSPKVERRPISRRIEIRKECLELMKQGIVGTEIAQQVADKYGLGYDSGMAYVKGAKADLVEAYKTDVEEKRSEIAQKYDDLYRQAREAKNFKECRNLLDSMAKLFGVQAQVEQATQNNIQVNFGGGMDGTGTTDNNTI